MKTIVAAIEIMEGFYACTRPSKERFTVYGSLCKEWDELDKKKISIRTTSCVEALRNTYYHDEEPEQRKLFLCNRKILKAEAQYMKKKLTKKSDRITKKVNNE